MVAEVAADAPPVRYERRTKLSLWTKLAFASGSLETSMLGAAGIATLVFYNQVLGVPPALCGTAFLISSVVDALADPLVGAWSDNVKTRWGRRHPFMFASAFILPAFFFCLYQPPAGLSVNGLFIWMTVFLVGVGLAKAIYLVPHSALGAELSDDYHERTAIFGWNYIVGALGGVVLHAFVLLVLFRSTPQYEHGLLNVSRYPWLAGIGAVFCFVVVLACTLFTADQIPYLHRKADLGADIKRRYLAFGHTTWVNMKGLLTNPSYISICVCWLILAVSGGILAVVSTYTFLYAFGLSTEQLSIRSFITLPGIFLAVPLSAWLVRRLDKKYTVALTIAITTTMLSLPYALKLIGWMPPNGSLTFLLVFFSMWVVGYITLPIVPIVIESQLVDIADDHELKTGMRAEGQIFSIRTFAIKLTNGIGGFLGGIGLQIIGFPTHAHRAQLAPHTVDGLLWLNGPVYWLIVAAGIGFVFIYRIDRTKHAETLRLLETRRLSQEGAP